MTDLFSLLPQFPSKPFSHILPSLDRNLVTTSDLLTLEPLHIAKRAQVPVAEVKKLQDALLVELHGRLGFKHGEQTQSDAKEEDKTRSTRDEAPVTAETWGSWTTISTLDEGLDSILGGGIPTGYITEIAGESGAGKTQTLLTLLLSAQLPPPHGLSRSSIYISTEAPLSTPRLTQILTHHPSLNTLSSSTRPSLDRVLSIQTPDLESQDHILRYQLPVAITRHNIGLVVIDSIAANYRAEFDKPTTKGAHAPAKATAALMAQRSASLIQLGAHLRSLARTHDVAIVVANQVADRFERVATPAATVVASRNTSYNSDASTSTTTMPTRAAAPSAQGLQPQTSTPQRLAIAHLATPDPMALDHQQRWFTGWGDAPPSFTTTNSTRTTNLKTPSLGLVWTNQLACRIVLVKEPVHGLVVGGEDEGAERGEMQVVRWRRWMRVVFAGWVEGGGGGREFEIRGGGVRSVDVEKNEEQVF